MQRKLTRSKAIDLIVARRTKGAAFRLDHDAYRKMLEDVRKQVEQTTDLHNAYEMYLYGVKEITQ